MPSQVEAPRSKHGDDGDKEHATKGKNDGALRQATKTPEARLGASSKSWAFESW
jgi:hypothetical protein